MTYRERERETIRRLREQLEQRQASDRTAPPGALQLDRSSVPEDEAEVLFELTCL